MVRGLVLVDVTLRNVLDLPSEPDGNISDRQEYYRVAIAERIERSWTTLIAE
jgi:hypothetical protein